MLSQKSKQLFSELGCEFQPVAVKFHYVRPEELRQSDKTLSFCQFLKEAQVTGEHFYIAAENDNCHGKVVLGMAPMDPFAAGGQIGYDFGVYRTPAANVRLHKSYPRLHEGSVNYVEFCPVVCCDFEPDLVICVAEMEQADVLMRATSYISGDLWESKFSCVSSCAWTYVYPYLSGKVNFCITGLHHGLKRREVYPAGRMIIAIPYQKLGEVCTALEEMPWELIAMKKDPESKAQLQAIIEHWSEISPD